MSRASTTYRRLLGNESYTSESILPEFRDENGSRRRRRGVATIGDDEAANGTRLDRYL